MRMCCIQEVGELVCGRDGAVDRRGPAIQHAKARHLAYSVGLPTSEKKGWAFSAQLLSCSAIRCATTWKLGSTFRVRGCWRFRAQMPCHDVNVFGFDSHISLQCWCCSWVNELVEPRSDRTRFGEYSRHGILAVFFVTKTRFVKRVLPASLTLESQPSFGRTSQWPFRPRKSIRLMIF